MNIFSVRFGINKLKRFFSACGEVTIVESVGAADEVDLLIKKNCELKTLFLFQFSFNNYAHV